MKPARRAIDRKAINVIHQILHIALRTPSEVADVFADWSPHVDQFYVKFYAKGWKQGQDPERRMQSKIEAPYLVRMRDQLLFDLAAIQAGKELEPLRDPRLDDSCPF